MDGTPEGIITLVDREIYPDNGVPAGEVENARLDSGHEAITDLVLTALNDELFRNQIEPGKSVLVPYRWVHAVGDIILINDVIERLKNPEEDKESLVA